MDYLSADVAVDIGKRTYPGPARERSRVVVHRVVALDVADGKHARNHVGRESPISNGLTTVAVKREVSTKVQSCPDFGDFGETEYERGANTRRLFGLI